MKKIFFLLAILLLTGITIQASAQVAGYSMSNPINAGTYSSSGSYSGTSNSATGGFTNNYGNAANDVWYSFTINGSTNTVLISLCGSSFDTNLHLLNSSGTEIANNDDNGPACTGVQSSLSMSNLAPGVYYVDAEGYSTNSGTIAFSLSVSISSPPVISYPAGTHAYSTGVAISPLSPSNTGGALAAVNQTLTFAGSGTAGQIDGNGTAASFNQPLGMAMDASGNLYVADAGSHVIRKVTPSAVVTTLAGGGYAGFANGNGAAALFNHPVGLATDASGNIYVADENNNAIRKITPAGMVTTLAGTGTAGVTNGASTVATFNYPCGVALDASGNVYVADYNNNMIRKVTSAGVVSTYAGTGTASSTDGAAVSATFNHPFGVSLDNSGNVYVTDRVGQRIRKITPTGTVSTLAGSSIGYADGTGTAAQFSGPTSLTLDAADNVYVTDETNQRIRKVTPAGVVTTIAGTGSTGAANGVGTAASFYNPFAIVAAPSGYIYIGDQYNYLVRKIIVSPYTINPSLPSGLMLDPSSGTISGTPTTGVAATSYAVTAYGLAGQSAQASVNLSVLVGGALNLSNQNYIVSYAPRVANLTTNAAVYSASADKTQVMANVQYFDGLGRPMQTVQVHASPSGRDIVEPIAYDQYDREVLKYLPYTASAAASDGSYKSTALTDQAIFYNNPAVNAAAPNIVSIPVVNTVTPSYAPINYEPSPLNRVVEQGAPGAAWQLTSSGITGSGHTVLTSYVANTSEVIQWTVNSAYNGATGTTKYAANSLYKTTLTDENGNVKIEYKDKQGQVVCKMVQNGGVSLVTYYVYDNYNKLAYVIPPIPATTTYPTSFLETDPVFVNFIYGYHYDARNRLIQKKVPGKGWEFMVYNLLDQIGMTQDANQRNQTPQLWTYTKYDAQGRVIITGLWSDSAAGADASIPSPSTARQIFLQNTFNTSTVEWETRDNTTATGYTNLSTPTGATSTYYTINYYDDYSFTGQPSTFTTPVGSSTMTKGLLTATKDYVLGTSNALWTISYYDDLGRVTTLYKQHYLGGVLSANNYDVINNTLYDFSNEVLTTVRKHYNTTNTTTPVITIANTYVYDHESRKKQTQEQIGGGTNVLLSENDYNEIGQLMAKNLHSTNSGTSYLQSISYLYNERGWLTYINDPSVPLSANKYFAERLDYNVVLHGATPKYNGDISEVGCANYEPGTSTTTTQYVTYAYDAADRLLAGNSSVTHSETGITYDNMGNLLTLTRAGTGMGSIGYAYTGNQLTTVTGYVAGTNVYDNNGNLKTDGTRGNAAITYNVLNLPQTVTAPSFNITYTYAADGTKLRKVSSTLGTTDYISGIQYKTNSTVIDFVQTEEGRAINTGSNWNYEYTLADHLGNNRATFDMINGKVGEDDYYPFGLDAPILVNSTNYYLYNKKEEQKELTEYDYGARFHDPVVARWTTVDPLAEDISSLTPYNYGLNNPELMIDADGREAGNSSAIEQQPKPKPKPKPGPKLLAEVVIHGVVSHMKPGVIFNFHGYSYTHIERKDPNDPSQRRFYGIVRSIPLFGLPWIAAPFLEATGFLTLSTTALTSGEMGEIIGWGTGQLTAEAGATAAAQTESVTANLTEDEVEGFINKGLTKEWVKKQLASYTKALLDPIKAGNNVNLLPRKALMEKILELWPK